MRAPLLDFRSLKFWKSVMSLIELLLSKWLSGHGFWVQVLIYVKIKAVSARPHSVPTGWATQEKLNFFHFSSLTLNFPSCEMETVDQMIFRVDFHIHVSTLRFLSHVEQCRVLSRVPCAIQEVPLRFILDAHIFSVILTSRTFLISYCLMLGEMDLVSRS